MEFIGFGSRPQLEKLSLDEIKVESLIIKKLNMIKLLGVYLYDKLSFQMHIMQKCKVEMCNLMKIMSIRESLIFKSCKLFIQALVNVT